MVTITTTSVVLEVLSEGLSQTSNKPSFTKVVVVVVVVITKPKQQLYYSNKQQMCRCHEG